MTSPVSRTYGLKMLPGTSVIEQCNWCIQPFGAATRTMYSSRDEPHIPLDPPQPTYPSALLAVLPSRPRLIDATLE